MSPSRHAQATHGCVRRAEKGRRREAKLRDASRPEILWVPGTGVMAGGQGKYSASMLQTLAHEAGTVPQARQQVAGRRGSLPASRRHCWVLEPPDDPVPHPVLVGPQRRGTPWFGRTIWYSEARRR